MLEEQEYFSVIAKIIASIDEPTTKALTENTAVYELGAAFGFFDSNEFRGLVKQWEKKLQCPNKGCHCNACFQ